jgi:hypothetical protein
MRDVSGCYILQIWLKKFASRVSDERDLSCHHEKEWWLNRSGWNGVIHSASLKYDDVYRISGEILSS